MAGKSNGLRSAGDIGRNIWAWVVIVGFVFAIGGAYHDVDQRSRRNETDIQSMKSCLEEIRLFQARQAVAMENMSKTMEKLEQRGEK